MAVSGISRVKLRNDGRYLTTESLNFGVRPPVGCLATGLNGEPCSKNSGVTVRHND